MSLQRPHVALAGLLLYCLAGILAYPNPSQREALIQLEASMQTGGQMVLTEAEQRLDAFLSLMKQKELMKADFPPAMHFFQARPLIRTSPIFSVLQKMPKGVLSLTEFVASCTFAFPVVECWQFADELLDCSIWQLTGLYHTLRIDL